MRLLAVLGIALSTALAACAGENTPTAPPAAPPPTPTQVATSATTPAPDAPLALAVHPSRAGLDLSPTLARRILAGEIGDWSELGRPGESGPLRVVAGPNVPAPSALRVATDAAALAALDERSGTVAVVPAAALGPQARALTVGSQDPLRDPAAYPLRVPAQKAQEPVVTLAIVGDVMLARRVGAAIGDDPAAPLRPTARRLAGADLTIGTLESTLSRLGPPTQGNDSFGADPAVLAGLELAGFDLLSLANNHVGDYGSRSLVQTVERLRDSGFATVGAGANAEQAGEPAMLEANGVRIGVLAFNSIGETPRPGPDRPGAVALAMQPRLGELDRSDLAAMTRAVGDLAARTDTVLVLPHWGDQYTPVAVRDQQRVGRALVDAGADLVVGSHPHVVQGAYLHKGKLIAHSLGNFVFDMDFSIPTQQGAILEVTLWGGQVKAAQFVPYRIGPDFAPRVLDERSRQGRAILGRIWANGGEAFTPP